MTVLQVNDLYSDMQFDYIIVGAGSAGCVLANRLSVDPKVSVLLLEAGGTDNKIDIHIPAGYGKLHRTEVDWKFWTEPQSHVGGRRIYLPRGKVLGGSSSTNAMAYVRGNRNDYEEWASLGNAGWGYEDVLPYFRKSEHNEDFTGPYHGSGGPLHVTKLKEPSELTHHFIRACNEQGIASNPEYNGGEQFGAQMLQFTMKDGKRHSTATAFLKPVMGRKNLTVITGALVHRVTLQDLRATGVVFSLKGEVRQASADREVILAAGAFQSPQLLMLSGIGDREELARFGIAPSLHLPGVGQNLQDHVWSGATGLSDIPSANRYIRPISQLVPLIRYLLMKKGPLCNSPLEANAFVRSREDLSRPDIQFHFVPLSLNDDYSTDIYDLSTFPTHFGYSILSILLHPVSRGQVKLRSSDPSAPPLIDPKLLSAPEDRELLLWGVKKAIDLAEAPAFRSIGRGLSLPANKHSDDALREHIVQSLETLYHPVGTCKMGSDAMAVVDSSLRVRGVRGLRVADASVMPTITSGNTNAPVIMIAEKAADLIRDQAT